MHGTLTFQDRFEITQVLARYGHVMDTRDFAGLAEIFAPEASFDVTSVGGPTYQGLPELVAFLELGDSVHPPFHLLTNAWVTVTDDGSVTSISKWLTIDRESGLPRSGDYHDRWVKTPQGWRIGQRVALSRWQGGAWAEGYEQRS